MNPSIFRQLSPFLHLYWRVSRGMTLGVRCAAFDATGRVALVRHTYLPGWHLPGGGVESGETAEESARREVREEVGAEAGEAPLQLHGVYWNRRVSRRDHVLLFVARDVRVIGPRRPDGEIAETGFFAPDALPENTTPATRARLIEIATGQAPSPLW